MSRGVEFSSGTGLPGVPVSVGAAALGSGMGAPDALPHRDHMVAGCLRPFLAGSDEWVL